MTLGTWREWARAHQDRQLTIEQLTTLSGLVAGDPAVLNEPLLVPGQRYEIVGSLDWARFRDRTGTNPDGDGGPLPVQSRQFVGDPQSPRDLTRYIRDHDPFDETQPQFTDEPLLIRYASGAVDKIYSAYGEQLVIRAKADSEGHVVVQPTAATAGNTFAPAGPVEQELLTALEAMAGACLPGTWSHLFPEALHTVRDPLLPNTAYTVSLLARPQSEPGALTVPEWLDVLETAFEAGQYVYRFDLQTSRWADPAAQLNAYAAARVGDLLIEDPAAWAAAVAGAPLRSDEAADALCVAATGGPVLIPGEPEFLRLWVPDGPSWRCVGLLLDCPEPLLRNRLRDDGAVEERMELDARVAASTAIPFALASPLPGLRIAAGARGARVFVAFDGGSGGAVLVRLHDRGPATATGPATDLDLAVAVPGTPASSSRR